jgi:hypothetical protein
MDHESSWPLRVTGLLVAAVVAAVAAGRGFATDYEVGEGPGMLAAIGEVPWESLLPGDRVLIHWRAEPYREKWVLCRRGTEQSPIVVAGVPGPGGELPVIDGRDAVTRLALDYWNEARGVLKIGGANVPPDTLPGYLVIEKLDIRSARPPYTFTNESGGIESYASNAAAIYVEKAEHLVIRDCALHDSGNGLFIGAFDGATQDILIERNWIHDNGIEGSYYEHNTYTAAIHITYQFNHLGRLRGGCGGNNLKDRSAGLVVRYNWIEDGNRQLDLVDAEDSQVLVNHPDYRRTFVYGNVLVEGDGEGNSQIVHYGGDSGTIDDYRKGTLHLFHNTVVSTRAGNTTLMRLSTNDEHADVRDNVVYTTAAGYHLALLDSSGVLELRDSWLRAGWVVSHGSFNGTFVDAGGNLDGEDAGFIDLATQDFSPAPGSPLIDAGGELHPETLPDHEPVWQYLRHQSGVPRPDDGARDLGAFEAGLVFADGFESGDTGQWSATSP